MTTTAFTLGALRLYNPLPPFLSGIANRRKDCADDLSAPSTLDGSWYASSLDLRLGLDVCELDHSDAWREWECAGA